MAMAWPLSHAITVMPAVGPRLSAYGWPACVTVSGVQHASPTMPQSYQKSPVIGIAPHVCDNPIAICTEIRYINQAQILGRGEVSGQTAGGLIHFYQKPGSTGFR
jgi:hypothetical protein